MLTHTSRSHPHPHVKVIRAKPSDPLDAFKHEIEAVEQAGTAAAADADGGDAAAAATAAGDGGGPDGRAGTPEELEFEDDDGTIYLWDRQLRKYVPAGEEGAAAAGSDSAAAGAAKDGYDIEAMTFVAEEEVLPTLAAARAAEEAAAAGSGKGKKVRVCDRGWACVCICGPASSCIVSKGQDDVQAVVCRSPATARLLEAPKLLHMAGWLTCGMPRCAMLCLPCADACSVLAKGVRAKLARSLSRLRELLQQTQQHLRQQQVEQQQQVRPSAVLGGHLWAVHRIRSNSSGGRQEGPLAVEEGTVAAHKQKTPQKLSGGSPPASSQPRCVPCCLRAGAAAKKEEQQQPPGWFELKVHPYLSVALTALAPALPTPCCQEAVGLLLPASTSPQHSQRQELSLPWLLTRTSA